jgi:hypothetical protein
MKQRDPCRLWLLWPMPPFTRAPAAVESRGLYAERSPDLVSAEKALRAERPPTWPSKVSLAHPATRAAMSVSNCCAAGWRFQRDTVTRGRFHHQAWK